MPRSCSCIGCVWRTFILVPLVSLVSNTADQGGGDGKQSFGGISHGVYVFGFITQIILLFSGVPALKMALIWLAMIIVYGIFVLFNRRMIYKILSTFNETKNSGQESLES